MPDEQGESPGLVCLTHVTSANLLVQSGVLQGDHPFVIQVLHE